MNMQERVNQVRVEPFKEIFEFGRFLSARRFQINETRKQIASECGVFGSTIESWENGRSFPDREKLPIIAKAYELDLAELTEKWKITDITREAEMKKRHNVKKDRRIIKSEEDLLSGSIESGKNRMRLNQQGPDFRIGRS